METHVISPIYSHTHTIIFLHQFNSNGPRFAEELFQNSNSLDLQKTFPHLKWIFPSSPRRHSIRSAKPLPQWFDIWSHSAPNFNASIQRPGLITSAFDILRLIDKECTLIPIDHIILAGIGQGCSTALFTLLCGSLRLCGFIGISGWLPFADQMVRAHNTAVSFGYDFFCNPHTQLPFIQATKLPSLPRSLSPELSIRDTPIFLAHSKKDILVPVSDGMKMSDAIKSLGFNVERKIYDKHSCWSQEPQSIKDLVSFIAICIHRS